MSEKRPKKKLKCAPTTSKKIDKLLERKRAERPANTEIKALKDRLMKALACVAAVRDRLEVTRYELETTNPNFQPIKVSTKARWQEAVTGACAILDEELKEVPEIHKAA